MARTLVDSYNNRQERNKQLVKEGKMVVTEGGKLISARKFIETKTHEAHPVTDDS